jgi:hypothetical protein
MAEVGSDSPRAGNLHRSRERRILLALLGIGAILLLSSLFVSWYQVEETNTTGCLTLSETLGPTGVEVGGTGSGCPPAVSGSFASSGLSTTGNLYEAVGSLAVAGGVLAAALLVLEVYRPVASRRSKYFLALGICAVVLAALSPTVLAMEQPMTICHDQGFVGTPLTSPVQGSDLAPTLVYSEGGPPYANATPPMPPPACNSWSFWTGSGSPWVTQGASGPWNSLTGSVSGPGSTFSWDLGLGWVLAIAGAALITAGPAIRWRAMRRP